MSKFFILLLSSLLCILPLFSEEDLNELFLQASAYLDLEDYEKAELALLKLVNHTDLTEEQSWFIRYNLGTALLLQDKSEEAIFWFSNIELSDDIAAENRLMLFLNQGLAHRNFWKTRLEQDIQDLALQEMIESIQEVLIHLQKGEELALQNEEEDYLDRLDIVRQDLVNLLVKAYAEKSKALWESQELIDFLQVLEGDLSDYWEYLVTLSAEQEFTFQQSQLVRFGILRSNERERWGILEKKLDRWLVENRDTDQAHDQIEWQVFRHANNYHKASIEWMEQGALKEALDMVLASSIHISLEQSLLQGEDIVLTLLQERRKIAEAYEAEENLVLKAVYERGEDLLRKLLTELEMAIPVEKEGLQHPLHDSELERVLKEHLFSDWQKALLQDDEKIPSLENSKRDIETYQAINMTEEGVLLQLLSSDEVDVNLLAWLKARFILKKELESDVERSLYINEVLESWPENVEVLDHEKVKGILFFWRPDLFFIQELNQLVDMYADIPEGLPALHVFTMDLERDIRILLQDLLKSEKRDLVGYGYTEAEEKLKLLLEVFSDISIYPEEVQRWLLRDLLFSLRSLPIQFRPSPFEFQRYVKECISFQTHALSQNHDMQNWKIMKVIYEHIERVFENQKTVKNYAANLLNMMPQEAKNSMVEQLEIFQKGLEFASNAFQSIEEKDLEQAEVLQVKAIKEWEKLLENQSDQGEDFQDQQEEGSEQQENGSESGEGESDDTQSGETEQESSNEDQGQQNQELMELLQEMLNDDKKEKPSVNPKQGIRPW